jgi:hypothetical protein
MQYNETVRVRVGQKLTAVFIVTILSTFLPKQVATIIQEQHFQFHYSILHNHTCITTGTQSQTCTPTSNYTQQTTTLHSMLQQKCRSLSKLE